MVPKGKKFGSLRRLNWIVLVLLITAVLMGEGEAAEESRDAAVLALVCNLNYRGYVLHSSYPDLIAARLLLKAQFGGEFFFRLS